MDQETFNVILNLIDEEKANILKQSYHLLDEIYVLDEDTDLTIKQECWTILVDNGFSTWRAKFKPNDTSAWFENYKRFLFHYLDIAIENDVDLFTIGTELVSMTRPQNFNFWQSIVNDIRASDYQGKLFYAAHEYEVFGVPVFDIGDNWDNPSQIEITPITDANISIHEKTVTRQFWKLFDYISMTVYFPLGEIDIYEVENQGPLPQDKDGDLDILTKKWEEKKTTLSTWKKTLNLENKKMIFAELGYRSVDYGHYKPYLPDTNIFNSAKTKSENQYNGNSQKNSHQAMLTTLNHAAWLDGIFLWEEQIRKPPLYCESENVTYSIINKPAADLFRKKFHPSSEITTLEYNEKEIQGSWYYYDDRTDGGGSTMIVENKVLAEDTEGRMIFKSIIEEVNNEIEQISQLSGVVSTTTDFQYGYLGMGIDFQDSIYGLTLDQVRQAEGIKFKTRGDGKEYRINVQISGIEDSNFHGKNFSSSSTATEITIQFKNSILLQQDWGDQTIYKTFEPKLIEQISFQTVGQPNESVYLQVWDLEIIE